MITTSRLTAVAALLITLAGVALLNGCGKGSDEATTAPPTQPAPVESISAPASTTEEVAPADTTTPEARITAAVDFVALDALRREFDEDGEKSAAIDAAFAARWESLAAGLKPQTLVDGLDLLGAATRVSGAKEYTFSLLFRPTVDLSAEYHLQIDAFVQPSHVQLLEGKSKERGYVNLPRRLNDSPTSQWKKGQYYVVHTKAEVPIVPYNLRLLAFSPTEDSFWNRAGQRLNLGWQWAAADENAFTAKVAACETPAELYALAPSGPRVSESLQKAIDEKWKALTAGVTAQRLTDDLEFVSIDTKATGERQYTFSFLVRSTADLKTDYIFSILGAVDPSHLQHIRPAKPGASHAAWDLELKHDPPSTWKQGQYHVAQLVIETELIPYDVGIWVSPRGADGKWDWEKKGKRINLGWQADIRK